jgi:DNA-binding CsgD family transcriptional regulator
MRTAPRTRDAADPLLSEQMLVEVIFQLPMGLICTDLAGEILFMNAAAKEMIEAVTRPPGECKDRSRNAALPELLPEIRRGIQYFNALLTQDDKTYSKPLPKLFLQNQAGFEVEFVLYSDAKELNRGTLKEARIIILLRSDQSMMPTKSLAKRFALTSREKEVLHYLINGKARKEIATAMNLSEETVRSYLRTLYEKLGAKSRVEAATFWLRLELLENLKSVLQLPQ